MWCIVWNLHFECQSFQSECEGDRRCWVLQMDPMDPGHTVLLVPMQWHTILAHHWTPRSGPDWAKQNPKQTIGAKAVNMSVSLHLNVYSSPGSSQLWVVGCGFFYYVYGVLRQLPHMMRVKNVTHHSRAPLWLDGEFCYCPKSVHQPEVLQEQVVSHRKKARMSQEGSVNCIHGGGRALRFNRSVTHIMMAWELP